MAGRLQPRCLMAERLVLPQCFAAPVSPVTTQPAVLTPFSAFVPHARAWSPVGFPRKQVLKFHVDVRLALLFLTQLSKSPRSDFLCSKYP